jgi:hypothetical protein
MFNILLHTAKLLHCFLKDQWESEKGWKRNGVPGTGNSRGRGIEKRYGICE